MEIVLRVSATTEPAKLAGAIFKNYQEGKIVKAKALGAAANFALCKAISIAHEYFESNNLDLKIQMRSKKETHLNQGNSGIDSEIRSFTATCFVSN